MLEISGGCFLVRLIRKLDIFPLFVPFLGGASYTCKYTVICMAYFYFYISDIPVCQVNEDLPSALPQISLYPGE